MRCSRGDGSETLRVTVESFLFKFRFPGHVGAEPLEAGSNGISYKLWNPKIPHVGRVGVATWNWIRSNIENYSMALSGWNLQGLWSWVTISLKGLLEFIELLFEAELIMSLNLNLNLNYFGGGETFSTEMHQTCSSHFHRRLNWCSLSLRNCVVQSSPSSFALF